MALIIIAEDDEQVRLIIGQMLEDDGHECLSFSNGDEALEGVRNNPGVDLLVLDIFMPFSDGRDLVTILRNGPPRFRNIPVLLISGVFPEDSSRLHTDDSKCKFLRKPFTGELFRMTINSLL